jgi:hypothetical protein
VLATGVELGLELPRPRAPDLFGVAGLRHELGLAQSRQLKVQVRVRNHVPPDARPGRDLPGSGLPPEAGADYDAASSVRTRRGDPRRASREAEGPAL